MTNPHIDPSRPRPLRDVASAVTKGIGMVTALVVAASGYGLITAVQGDAVVGLLGLIPGVLTGIGNVVVAFGVAGKGEPKVTPTIDPRTNDGQALLPAGTDTPRRM